MPTKTIKRRPTNRQLGTKGKFREWLLSLKRITYTKYTTLAPEVKVKLYDEYHKV